MNPDYMYPDLSMPWNDRYMKQKDPELRNYWSGLYNDLPEDFKPDAAHTYKEDELVALAKDSPASKKKGKKWPTILQEARSMQANMHQLLEGDVDSDDGSEGKVNAMYVLWMATTQTRSMWTWPVWLTPDAI